MQKLLAFGANGSLGTSISTLLAARGYSLCTVDIHAPCDYITDLTKETEVRALFDQFIKQKIEIAGVLNLVGKIESAAFYSPMRSDKYIALDDWKNLFDINLHSAFILAKEYHRYCQKIRKKCNLVNISSISAEGNPGQVAYSSSKAALEILTVTLAKELGPSGHRFNVVSPGFIDVSSTISAMRPDQIEKIIQQTPTRCLGDVNSIVNGIVFSLESSFVNGNILRVDGGLKI